MTASEPTFVVFIDYDNLLPTQKTTGILDVVTKVLVQTPSVRFVPRSRCEVRIYGGWYEGSQITQLAQNVTIEIQRDFPAIIRIPISGGSAIAVASNAELAVSLMQEPGHHMFNTYRRKGKPANIRIETPQAIGCIDNSCPLPLMKKLLRHGNCPKLGCSSTHGDLVYRHEQKLVDTMLSCDLVHAATAGATHVVLVSGDDDFLPPLRTVLLKGMGATRFHPKPNCPRASFPVGGATLTEVDL